MTEFIKYKNWCQENGKKENRVESLNEYMLAKKVVEQALRFGNFSRIYQIVWKDKTTIRTIETSSESEAKSTFSSLLNYCTVGLYKIDFLKNEKKLIGGFVVR